MSDAIYFSVSRDVTPVVAYVSIMLYHDWFMSVDYPAEELRSSKRAEGLQTAGLHALLARKLHPLSASGPAETGLGSLCTTI